MMYRKFFFRLFVIVVLLVLTDVALGGLFRHFYQTCRYGIFGRQVYCFTRSDEDLLILGPSTASHHYVPSILSDSLGMSCFNAGSDGMTVFYHYGVLSNYKRERKPEMVIYDFGPNDWCESQGATFTLEAALDRLAPHCRVTPEIDSLFLLEGVAGKVKLLSQLYCYNSKVVQLIKCHFIPSPEDAGYEALDSRLPAGAPLRTADSCINRRDVLKEKYLQKLIDYTRANDIRLLFVLSPRYARVREADISVGKEIAARNGVPVIDMQNASELMKPEYFADESHLNDKGARLFTSLLAGRIREVNKNCLW